MEIAQGILSKTGENLVESTIKHGRYIFCFKSIVEDLREEETNLKVAQELMEQRVETAKRNTEIIEKDVEKWQTDTSNILAEVQRLKEEIEVKKSCLSGWCPNWGCRYTLSRKAAKKMSIMIKLRDCGNNFDSVGHPAPLPGLEFSATKYFDFFQSSKAAFDQIIEVLRKDETSLVGLYGMGGAGKTSLAIKLGIQVKEEKIFDEVVMVAVSQTPNFKVIQSKLARLLDVELKEEDEEERAKRLYLRFTGTNRETDAETKKILVILDDVWEKFDLRSKIGFPFGEDNTYCKLLLTTRKKDLCTAIGCQLRILLNLLNEDEGLTLLKRHANLNDNSLTSEELNTLAIEVARECKGLPLAIETVGSALKEKDIEEWKLVLEMLKTPEVDDIYEVVDVGVDVVVYACLKLSYDYLRDEKTKLCFLLCSLFPEDYRIHVEELVPYGIGLELFPSSHSFEEVRRRLHVILNSLKASCLLLDANENCVKMHDVVRDVARWITSKGDNEFMTKFGMGLMVWSNEVGREICPKLKILLLSGMKGMNMLKISNACFKEMKALKVLILQFADLSIKSLEALTNLKVLQLFDCTLRDIPDLENFDNLEVICYQSYSDFDRSEEIIPSNLILRKLTLDRLPSLTCFFPQNYLSARPSSVVLKLSKCPNLTTFFVSEVKMQDQKLGVSSLQNLTEVYVYKCHKLRNLFSSTLAQNLLQLRKLTIEECEELEQIIFKDDEDGVDAMNDKEIILFPQLERLILEALPNLTHLCPAGFILFGVSSLPNLTEVLVKECHKIKNLFPSTLAQNLLQLRELAIVECEELEQIIFKDDEDGVDTTNGKEIVLVPELKKLSLMELPRLTSFCPAGYQLTLNLETLWMAGFQEEQICVRILSCLRDVRRLYIWYCGVQEILGLSNGSTHVLALQNLTELSVRGCHKLRNIVVPNLSQLKDLTVIECKRLEEINMIKDEDDEENHVQAEVTPAADDDDVKQLALPRLVCLSLGNLGSLAKFCPVNYHLIFPSLQILTVEGCPKIETRFSYENENGSVRAEGKPSEDNQEPSLDIKCWDSEQLRRQLPSYKEKIRAGAPSKRE